MDVQQVGFITRDDGIVGCSPDGVLYRNGKLVAGLSISAPADRLQDEWLVDLVETANLTPMAFPLWADRLSATLPAGDAASRLEAMLHALNQAAG